MDEQRRRVYHVQSLVLRKKEILRKSRFFSPPMNSIDDWLWQPTEWQSQMAGVQACIVFFLLLFSLIYTGGQFRFLSALNYYLQTGQVRLIPEFSSLHLSASSPLYPTCFPL
jgi:hypothetical protein